MEFYANLAIVRRHVWLVFVTVAAASMSAVVWDHYYHAEPMYIATATLSLNPGVPNRALLTYDPSLAPANRTTPPDLTTLVSTYDLYLVDAAFDQKVVDDFHLPVSAAVLGSATSSRLVPNTMLYRISATSTDGHLASREAKAVAQGFIQADARVAAAQSPINPRFAAAAYTFWTAQVRSIQDQMLAALNDQRSSTTQKATRYAALNALLINARANESDAVQHAGFGSFAGQGSVMAATLVSTEGPDLLVRSVLIENIVVVAALGGLIAGLALALLREYLNTTIRDADEASRDLSLPVLSSVGMLYSRGLIVPILARLGPRRRERDAGYSSRLVTVRAPFSRGSEAFRTLRTSILFSKAVKPIESLVISSAAPGEGKSLLAANLAVAMAQSGRQVILVDADLHRPTQHLLFETSMGPGLTTLYLVPESDVPRSLDAILQKTEITNLRLLAAGPPAAHPAEMLASARTGDLFSALRQHADLVIVDTPAMGSRSDAVVLAAHTDGAIMVIRAHGSRRDAVRVALGKLNGAGTCVLGLVLNMADSPADGGLRRYAYGDSEASDTSSTPSNSDSSPAHERAVRAPVLPNVRPAPRAHATSRPGAPQLPNPAVARFSYTFSLGTPAAAASMSAATHPGEKRHSLRLYCVLLAVPASIGLVLIGHALAAFSAPNRLAPSPYVPVPHTAPRRVPRTMLLVGPTAAVVGDVRPESSVVVRGAGFQSGEIVTLALNGRALSTRASLVADTKGAFTADVAALPLVAGFNDLSAIGSTGSTARPEVLADTRSQAMSYIAGGFEGQGSQSVLDLMNAGPGVATAYVTFYGVDGRTTKTTLSIAAHARFSVPVATLTSLRGPFGLRMVSSPDVQSQLDIRRDGRDGDTVTGVANLSRYGYLAEGYTGFGFREQIAIFNPSEVHGALVVLHLLPVGAAPHDVFVTVRAHTTAVVDVGSVVSGRGVSVIFSSNRAVLVARTLTFSRDARGVGYGMTARTAALTAATAWLFAGGQASAPRTTLIMLNPNTTAATATMRFYGRDGLAPRRKTVLIPARSRVAVALASLSLRGEVASLTTSALPIVVEQTQYVRSPDGVASAGDVSVGVNGPATRWSFPGNASVGGTQVLQLFNPSSTLVTATVKTYTSAGVTTTRRVVILAHSRLGVQTAGPAQSTPLATLVQAPGPGVVASQLTTGANQSTLASAQGTAR